MPESLDTQSFCNIYIYKQAHDSVTKREEQTNTHSPVPPSLLQDDCRLYIYIYSASIGGTVQTLTFDIVILLPESPTSSELRPRVHHCVCRLSLHINKRHTIVRHTYYRSHDIQHAINIITEQRCMYVCAHASVCLFVCMSTNSSQRNAASPNLSWALGGLLG